MHGLGENRPYGFLQDEVSELEIHVEMHQATLLMRGKIPAVMQVFERAVLVFHLNRALARGLRGDERDAGGEAFAERAEADGEIRHQLVADMAADARAHAPGQE